MAAPLTVRLSRVEDAEDVGRMAAAFADYLRALGDETDFRFDAAAFRRDGFGPDRAFIGLIAEQAGRPVGYLHYHLGYDADSAQRMVVLADLWVEPDARGLGVGRALMREAARQGRERQAPLLFWAVYKPNRLAAGFYEKLGARYLRELDFMIIEGATLEA
ncbi:MAG TPA: GNAT family N-acetyltransferase [Hypericibacter adhaerens]|uniref:N-acetyltransferase n=1 Tax=Hypericibacter adhaerens TaxID=2602016 RepID=A0A5J6N5Q9_9PROT|nr:GNAT family N-acetyltransferase [Hypericibacter adhaerens]QEX24757.1 N-acetyltransferase [Hypericibacter adhaerens]HWA43738.1 GNAT family N-acetyltransferase [Hypericibacter adhaerens]